MALEQLPMLPGQTTLVERVRYQLSVGTAFVFVTGQTGSGKTVLCEKLSSVIDEEFLTAFVPCTPKMSLVNLREVLLQQLSPQTIFNQEDKLLGTVQRINFGESKVCIVVDNIDKADESFLVELADIYQTFLNDELFHIVVTSDPSWADSRIKLLKENGIVPVEIEIPHLSKQDKLIELDYYFRLYGVRYTPQELSTIDRIDNMTTPEDVRVYAQFISSNQKEFSMAKNEQQARTVTNKDNTSNNFASKLKEGKSLKLYIIIAIAALVIILIPIFWLSLGSNDYEAKTTTANEGELKGIEGSVTPKEPELYDNKTTELTDTPVVVGDSDAQRTQVVVTDEAIKTIEKANDDKVATKDSANVQVTKQDDKNAVTQATNEANAKEVVSDPLAKGSASDKATTDETKATTDGKEVANVKNDVVDTTETSNKEATQDTAKVDANKDKAQQDNVIRTDMANMPNKNYSVQLIATPKKAVAEKLATRVGGDVWVGFRKKDKQYIVLWGNFASPKDATKAIKELPADVRKAGPWAKSFFKIKKELGL